MQAMSAALMELFSWVVQASTHATVVIVIIAFVQLIGRRWIPSGWSYALWLILVVRMALPLGFESSLSLWNMLPAGMLNPVRPEANERIGMSDLGGAFPADSLGAGVGNSASARHSPPESSRVLQGQLTTWRLLPVIWLAGALSLLVIIALSNLRLWWSVRKTRLVTEQPIIELLEDCKQLMKVRAVVGLVVTDHVKSPSLFGFVRPRILLPSTLAGGIPLEDLRYIFLHELAHLKRGDIWIGWIVAALQSLHWFNPLVWWAFVRMRGDREVACDAHALSHLRSEESGRYGGTLVNLMERFNSSETVPVVAGIVENKAQLKRRLTMITQFKPSSRCAVIMSAALLAVLSAALLTDAKDNVLMTQDQNIGAPRTSRPIRVGGGVQEAKLIRKVDPVYPERAKASALSGTVRLSVTVGEDGYVTDVQAVDGHPVLCAAAAEAVRQWQYSKTLLGGEPVSVTTTVTVHFSSDGTVDTAFKAKPSDFDGFEILPILISADTASPEASGSIRLKAGPFLSYRGRDYYTVVPGMFPPEVVINKQRLRDLANSGWPTAGREAKAMMLFELFIDEDGQIAGIRQMQGPKIAEIDDELANARVVSPARLEIEAVPSWVAVEIAVPKPSQIGLK